MTDSNLDFTAAKLGFSIVKKATSKKKPKEVETLINKSLGVLSSNGVYALWLFLQSEKENENIDILYLINQFGIELNGSSKEDEIITLSDDIHNLLFAKEAIEKTLVYARYHVKAMK
ncbi:MAG: hypothetical protein C5S46_06065 [Candidatus Methanomarinus sp.]|jgi:hypothetical protein|uniref:Uncharacterized protein n=1 Tax=Candidatus Methanomarinus sp. TaxID=3386244 RepID=A0AC61S9T7_9EURY|nr:MAG: hypothetical protein C5S46_06065 [ANME-2 cluster archaeon]